MFLLYPFSRLSSRSVLNLQLGCLQAPQGIHAVCKKFPKLKIVTSEIDASLDEHDRVLPGMGEFGDRYFGTDYNNNTTLKSQSSSEYMNLGTPK